MAQGDPVAIGDLAAVTGRTEPEILAPLATVPDTEYDGDGRLIGQGQTLPPTRHGLEFTGEHHYTWCVLDTLVFPPLPFGPAQLRMALTAAHLANTVSVTAAAAPQTSR